MRFRQLAFSAVAGATLALAGAATANADGTSVTVPVAGMIDSPCTAEPVFITGSAHLMVNASTGHVTDEANLQGVSGVGLLTGYHYVDQTQQTEWSRFKTDGSSAGHYEFSEHLIRQREASTLVVSTGDDLYAKILLHVSFDANGTPTVRQDMSDDGCR
jgi:hypothetical protein